MRGLFPAALAHVFTALGVIPAFLALIDAMNGVHERAFIWLGVALIIDGLDGPLARRLAVKQRAPRFCGERLDLIIDYITYVVVPAVMIHQSELVPEGLRTAAACLALLSALYHFSDTASKTSDDFFVGFPAVWNLVVFYLFCFPIGQGAALAVIVICAALTFTPLVFVHPVRVTALRPLTFAVMAAWAAAAVATVANGFPAEGLAQIGLAAGALYALGVGFARSAGRLTRETAPGKDARPQR
ncbi:MAG: CDP-alcohol phosphatidyltransferase family protein [Hyphomicrobiales bacterium]|nr:CDP-alcohol phosphatidyltransferase family protein [Hyphomicrobiales bacterium]